MAALSRLVDPPLESGMRWSISHQAAGMWQPGQRQPPSRVATRFVLVVGEVANAATELEDVVAGRHDSLQVRVLGDAAHDVCGDAIAVGGGAGFVVVASERVDGDLDQDRRLLAATSDLTLRVRIRELDESVGESLAGGARVVLAGLAGDVGDGVEELARLILR